MNEPAWSLERIREALVDALIDTERSDQDTEDDQQRCPDCTEADTTEDQ